MIPRAATMLRAARAPARAVIASSSRMAAVPSSSRLFSQTRRICKEGGEEEKSTSGDIFSSTQSKPSASTSTTAGQSQRDIWTNLLQSVNRTAHNSSATTASFGPLANTASSSGERMSQNEIMEKLWLNRTRYGSDIPGKDWYGRIAVVNPRKGDFAGAVARLNVLLRRDNVKGENIRNQRYEKPTQRRRRIEHQRHKRRFEAYIREKVQLVKYLRSRGA